MINISWSEKHTASDEINTGFEKPAGILHIQV
jgi:hypothetical protein